ncbi:MAG: hypothetical protein IJ998_04105 [Alistipes sp.]|nr:hypothetical protein [Alistipes sp.]
MRSVQKALRLQLLQCSPDQTEWKWSAAASTNVRSSVAPNSLCGRRHREHYRQVVL